MVRQEAYSKDLLGVNENEKQEEPTRAYIINVSPPGEVQNQVNGQKYQAIIQYLSTK